MQAPFSTADLGQAAFLMSMGQKFLGAEVHGRDRVVFKFADDIDGSASERALLFANNGMAPAKSLLEAMRFLKSILRDVRPNIKSKVENGEIMTNGSLSISRNTQ